MAIIHSDAPPVHRPWMRNLGFGAGSVLLLLGTLWMVWFDYMREWKQYQREFRSLEIAKSEASLMDETARLDANAELAEISGRLTEADEFLKQHNQDLVEARAEVEAANNAFYVAEEHWKVEKSYYDAKKYEFEEEREHILESGMDDAASQEALAHAQEVLDGYFDRYQKSVLELEAAKTAQKLAEARVTGILGDVEDLERQMGKLTETEDILKRKIETLIPTLTTRIRNAPLIDLASPTLKVEQVILPHLLSDINFMTIPKVDRCVTCHKGIMSPGYEEEVQPFTAHPRLDLYLSDTSPHPYNQIGCTVCHQGLDRATSFASAMHTPRDAQQGEEWEHEYDWHNPHYWDYPQLPAQHVQAACRTCHASEVRVRGADRYNASLDILERAGCYGCHKIEGYTERRKAGPDLTHVASKVTEDWAYAWVQNPRSYRPNTWMPTFFNLSNTSTPEYLERNKVEIDAIVAYIFDVAEDLEPTTSRVPRGDAERGRQLTTEKGCLGCHRIEENPQHRGTYGRDFGPALDRVGDKVSAAWLYDWVRNPKRYFPETNMPSLRLSDSEAADIVAYLMSLKGPAMTPRPAVNSPLLEEVALEYLRARLTNDQAVERLASMNEDDRRVFLGEKLIARYGCFGCHVIPGFEDALPIGTELTGEGSKLITRLDFGLQHIPHTKPAWFYAKMKNPRIFDEGKVKLPQEKLKMPDFGFTDEEADTMVTLIMSFQKDIQPPGSHRVLDERMAAIERGRRIVQDKNCRGCHPIEGEGGAIQETIADQAYWPPNLFREGDKVQSDWLYGFVRQPEPIRPWLKAKMPTFHFDEEQAAEIVRYFAAADGAPYPFQIASDEPASDELLSQGRRTFDQFRCMSCHPVGAPPPGANLADLAPNLELASGRLRHDWIEKWLRDPQALMPGTRMPGFFYLDGKPLYDDSDERMKAVSEYVLTLGEEKDSRASR